MVDFIEKDGMVQKRSDMVDQQLVERGITDASLLEAFKTIPRHLFVDPDYLNEAYEDTPLPIKEGQTISQPYVVALMLDYLQVAPVHNVLEIGSGSGYASALLSKLAHHVDAVEVFLSLLESSQKALEILGIENVSFDHRSAWEQSASPKVYDRIVLWASPPRIPEYLFQSLKPDGILVAPEGKHDQHIWIYQLTDGQLQKSKKESVRFVPLVQGTTTQIDMFR